MTCWAAKASSRADFRHLRLGRAGEFGCSLAARPRASSEGAVSDTAGLLSTRNPQARPLRTSRRPGFPAPGTHFKVRHPGCQRHPACRALLPASGPALTREHLRRGQRAMPEPPRNPGTANLRRQVGRRHQDDRTSRPGRAVPAHPAPSCALQHAAAPRPNDEKITWTGHRLLVWGGLTAKRVPPPHGEAYTPATSKWTSLPASPLRGRQYPVAVRTGRRMIVWAARPSAAAASPTERSSRPPGETSTCRTDSAIPGARVSLPVRRSPEMRQLFHARRHFIGAVLACAAILIPPRPSPPRQPRSCLPPRRRNRAGLPHGRPGRRIRMGRPTR
jgi:hypothetical protein